MIKKIFSPILALLLVQFQIAFVFSQSQASSRPTFEEVYKNYSFLETTELSVQHQYTKEEVEKEKKALLKKEREERKQTRKEHLESRGELRKRQKQLSDVSKKITLVERKYEEKKEVTENGKKRTERFTNKEALEKDPDYQSLKNQKDETTCKVLEWEQKSDSVAYKLKLESSERYYEALGAQLDLLTEWPLEYQKIQEDLKTGESEERKFANPQDTGLRDLGFGDQMEDLKILQHPQVQQEIQELKKKEYKNPYVKAYALNIIQYLAENSDLKVPILEENVLIVDEDDINAFAIPGGFIGITRGLLEEAESEAEFAGVMAHEMSHVAARHGQRLMSKVNLINLLLQGALIAGAILTGGITAGLYYGIQGVGAFLSLTLLGVSRDFELEADTLGMQYLWKAGYDPLSFMNFFEKMGKNKGYLRSTSWLRTHPAFAKRFTNALREYQFLPPQDEAVVTSDAFLKMKAQLCVDKEIQKENADKKKQEYKPTLHRKENRQKSDREKAMEHCGVKQQKQDKKSFCDDPALEQYKEEIRKQRKENPQETPEKTRPTLKRK